MAYMYEGEYAAKDESLVNEGKVVTALRIGRWQDEPDAIDRVFEQFSTCPELFDVLEYFGYETSRDWLDAVRRLP
jgi:hypothetical protein